MRDIGSQLSGKAAHLVSQLRPVTGRMSLSANVQHCRCLEFASSRCVLAIHDKWLRSEILARYSLLPAREGGLDFVRVRGRLNVEIGTEFAPLRIDSTWAQSVVSAGRNGEVYFARGSNIGTVWEAGSWSGRRIRGRKAELATDLVLAAIDREIAWHISLSQPTFVFFHAAILVDERLTVVLLGGSGSGKTTLAEGLMARGMHLVTDDVAPWDPANEAFHHFPRISMRRNRPQAKATSDVGARQPRSRGRLCCFQLRLGKSGNTVRPLLAGEALESALEARLFDDPRSATHFNRSLPAFVHSSQWFLLPTIQGRPELATDAIVKSLCSIN